MQRWWNKIRSGERSTIVPLAAGVTLLVVFVIAYVLSTSTPTATVPTGPAASFSAEPTQATPVAGFKLITPGPTVPAGHWRWTGLVVDSDDKPLADVCVHIGPGDCRFNSVRTDANGKWVIDFPQVNVQYDFHFTKTGYQQLDTSIVTTKADELKVRMVKQ